LLDISTRESGWPFRLFAWAAYLLAFTAPVSIVAAQFFAAIILVWGHLLIGFGARKNQLHFWHGALILTFLAITLLSSMLSTDFNAAIPQLKKSWALFCFFPLVVLSWTFSARNVIKALICGTALASLIGIARFLFADVDRAAPFSGGYTTLAIFEAACLPLAIIFLSEKGRNRLFYGIGILAIAAGLLLTETRAGWVSAIVAVAIVGLFLNRKIAFMVIASAVIIVALMPQTRDIIRKRLASDKQGGFTSGRLYLWSQAREPLSKLPVMGYGPGSFKRLAPDSLYEIIGDPGIKSWHCTPIDILIESGPFAMAAIIGIMLIPIVTTVRKIIDGRKLPQNLGLFAALIAVYLAGLTTNLFRDFLLLCLLGILWALSFGQEEETLNLRVS
jgi:O-antigen ligase